MFTCVYRNHLKSTDVSCLENDVFTSGRKNTILFDITEITPMEYQKYGPFYQALVKLHIHLRKNLLIRKFACYICGHAVIFVINDFLLTQCLPLLQ